MNLKTFIESINERKFPTPWPGHFIAQKWQTETSGTAFVSINPNNNEVLSKVFYKKSTFETATQSAQIIRPHLAKQNFEQRIEKLRSLHQALADYKTDLVRCLNISAGKPAWEAQQEVESTLTYLKHLSQHSDGLQKDFLQSLKSRHGGGSYQLQPIGTIGAYLSFSTPFASFVHTSTAAILSGNPLILVIPPAATLLGIFFSFILENLEFEEGSFANIFTDFKGFYELIENKSIAAILYTGSLEHCNNLIKDSSRWTRKKLLIKSGGKNATIIHSSADLDKAVQTTIIGAFQSCGELCSASSRVFVYRSHIPEFKEKLLAALDQMLIGPSDAHLYSPQSEPNTLGPLHSKKAVERFLRFQTMALRDADESWQMGKALERLSSGNFVNPGVHYFNKFSNEGAHQSNVLFSPDLCVYPYDVLEDVIQWTNECQNPFVVSFIGESSAIIDRRHMLSANNILIYLPTTHVEFIPPQISAGDHNQHFGHGLSLAFQLSKVQVLTHA
ncbi:MAG: aldehyde dehydrogenase family protein [Oligoflexales bacterium]|nr:aldehyde dehydrogenase family protein [Oligoflexales bacterium]